MLPWTIACGHVVPEGVPLVPHDTMGLSKPLASNGLQLHHMVFFGVVQGLLPSSTSRSRHWAALAGAPQA